MKTEKIRFTLGHRRLIFILGLLATIASVVVYTTSIILELTPQNKKIIVWFFAALLPYLFLAHKVNKHEGKLLFSKNNLALVNTIGALSLLVFYVMHFWNIFKPVNQILFDWPALIGFILLGLVSYSGFKERIHRYARRMKFWKKSFWRRQFHKSFYRVIIRLLPKTGLIFIALGFSALIMNFCLNPENQAKEFDFLGLILIFLGAFIWLFTSLFIINMLFISATAEMTGKTYAEVEKEMMLSTPDDPLFRNNMLI